MSACCTPAFLPRSHSTGNASSAFFARHQVSATTATALSPTGTTFLTPGDYGVVALVDTALNLLAIVAGSRLSAGIYRFYHKAESVAERRTVVSTAFLLVLATYGVLAGGFALAAPAVSRLLFDTDAHTPLLRIAAATFAVGGLVAVPSAFLVVTDRAGAWVVANLVKLVAHASLNIVLIAVLGMGLRGYFLSGLIIHVVFAVALVWLQLRVTGLRFGSDAARSLLRFWWPLIFTQLAVFVVTYGDRPFLQKAAGTASVGLYALAYNFGFLVATLGFAPFARVWESVRFRYAKLTEGRDAAFSRAFVSANVMLVTTAVGILLFVGDFLRLTAKPEYHGAASMVPALAVAYLLQSWSGMHEVGILVTERTSHTAVANWVAGIVALVGYALLIPTAAVVTGSDVASGWSVFSSPRSIAARRPMARIECSSTV